MFAAVSLGAPSSRLPMLMITYRRIGTYTIEKTEGGEVEHTRFAPTGHPGNRARDDQIRQQFVIVRFGLRGRVDFHVAVSAGASGLLPGAMIGLSPPNWRITA